ncbi:MAG: thrombospondin type 3 repeat-containing protein [Chitinophagales bacterium]
MKKIISLLCFIATLQVSLAQLHMGLHSDNYAGIYNINFQPADIVDSRYRFDMNIFQTEFTFVNNYIGLKKEALLNSKIAFSDPDFGENYLSERLNGRVKKAYMEFNTQMPLSFYFQFGKKMKNALGFSSRLRYNMNVGGVQEDFAHQIYNSLDIVQLQNVAILNKDLSIQTAAWAEIGLTYGREIIDLGDHYVKGAFTGKLNQGFASLYTYSDNLNITFPTDSTVSINNSDITYDISTNFLDFSNSAINPETSFKLRPSFSADFGFVYEWRPNVDEYKYELDGNPNVLNPKKNKYKLKASLSFTDIGFLRFLRSPHSKKITANFNNITTNELGRLVEDFGANGLASIDSAYRNAPTYLGTTADNEGKIYQMRLPFKMNIMLDYHIWKGFYVNATASIAPSFKNDENKTIGLSHYSITPRYEHRWVGVQLPLSLDGVGRGHVGLGLRAGPIVFGTNDLIPLMAGKNYKIQAANFYVGAKIPIFARIKDKDKDHVSNKFDECRKEKGTWANKGCPNKDKDNDGILDSEDKCPDIPGIEALEGCPDKDKDGITDANDECPEIAGIEEFKGCPDTDKDGIKDSEDECPEVAGILAFKGCPDTDGDGITDAEDNCPEIVGTIENKGCPFKDTDGDGIKDIDDKCPELKGPAANDGCPYADTDGDGVIDIEDNCIKTPGPKENKGCPVIEEEVSEALKVAFDNLQFVSGKSIIKASSYSSLQNLATILKENPSFKLRIKGHTDSVGSESSNLNLSRSRANAVKIYLNQYEISASRFIIEAYGESMPTATNDTAEGREKNRRVEMEIVMD